MARRTGPDRPGSVGVDLCFPKSSRTFLSLQPVALTFKPRLVQIHAGRLIRGTGGSNPSHHADARDEHGNR